MNWCEYKKTKLYFILPIIVWWSLGFYGFSISHKEITDYGFLIGFLCGGILVSSFYYFKQRKGLKEKKRFE